MLSLSALPAHAVPILLDLHTGGHGAAKTDGVAWFQDNHDKHDHTLNFLTFAKDEPNDDGTLAGHNGSAAGGASEYPKVFSRMDIKLSEVPLFFGYRIFLFDGNQQQKAGVYDHLDMTSLMLYTAGAAQDTLANIQTNGMLAYDMDGGVNDYTVRIEGRVGNAGADMHLFVPDSLFHVYGTPEDTFVYLFSAFEGNDDGREHWNLGTGEFDYREPVPLPATWQLLAGGLVLLRIRRDRNRQNA
jgi:hypothetical protein